MTTENGKESPKVTQGLARLAKEITLKTLPDEVIERSKCSILDSLGLKTGGAFHPATNKVIAVGDLLGGAPQAALPGRTQKSNVAIAAWCNAYAAHVLDFDDTHYEFLLHANTPIVHALMAAAEHYGADGPSIIESYVAGYEVTSRLTRGLWPYHHRQGWHVTGTVGTFGAAVAVGKLLGLDKQGFIYALGLAGAQAAGLQANRGTMSKGLHPAKAAMNGVMAALLAREGFTSSVEVIEHPKGFASVFTPTIDLEKIALSLDGEFETLKCGYKPYPCGVVIHPVIDAAVDLREQGVDIDQVEELEFRVHPYVVHVTGVETPRTGLEAKFSAGHCAAVGLHQGSVTVPDFTDDQIQDPGVLKVRDKVQMKEDSSVPQPECLVQITYKDGRTFQHHVVAGRGTEGNPLEYAQLADKFKQLTQPVIGENAADRLVTSLRDLDRLENVSRLFEELRSADAKSA